ncbi:MAG: DHA2 family efflux MFS transporter permease subunit [Janthinobacterium lividum]
MTSESVLKPELEPKRPATENTGAEGAVAHAEEAMAPSAAQFEPGVPLEPLRTASRVPELLTPERIFNPWIIALVVTMGTFMEVLDTSIANVALPHIAGSLSASQDESTWVLTSYLVANAIILPISGWISSVVGRKNFYLFSVVLFTVFSAACGIAPTLATLVIFRVLQGLCGGGLQPSVQAILADAFPGEKRGMAMAVYTVAILCAPVLGPTLGGWITDNYSWRWIFYINIPVGILCAIFTRIVLRDPPQLIAARLARKGQPLRIDGTGLALVAIGLASLEIVLDRGQELDWFGNSFIAWSAGIAVVSLVGAVWWELRVKNPIVNLHLLKERNFLICCTIILGLYTALYACTFLLPQFMQELLGYNATNAGLAVSPAGLVTMIEVPIVGWLLSRGTDARRLIALGIVTITAGTYWLSLANLEVAERNLVWPRVVQILGLGLTTVPISTIMFRFLPADQSSNAAGIYALVRNEGGSIGIALSSTFLQRTAQAHQTYLGSKLTASNGLVQQASHVITGAQGFAAGDSGYASLSVLYGQLQRQAELLAYMDQYRLFAYILLALLPLVLLLKKPPRIVGKIELDAH